MVSFNCTTACRTSTLDDVERYSNGREKHTAAEQIGRERRERERRTRPLPQAVLTLVWCGEGRFDSRRRVNSTVGRLSHSLANI